MNATLNTFPPFQSMAAPRGWILAVIVLVHLGFLWLLSSGMAQRLVAPLRPQATLVDIKTKPPEPTQRPADKPIDLTDPPFVVPTIDDPSLPPIDAEDVIAAAPIHTETIAGGEPGTAIPREPVIVLPQIDSRVGLSEPLYPSADIRAGHTGTVHLSVYVLENGRVGDVRLDQSSGYARLDESALREARRWRLKPGMRDGVPVAMWKKIPITFQLQGSGTTRF